MSATDDPTHIYWDLENRKGLWAKGVDRGTMSGGEAMSEWESVKARLENEIALWPVGEHEGWDGFVADIRAALERVEELERAEGHPLYCGECGQPGECACLGNWRERAEAAEAEYAAASRDCARYLERIDRLTAEAAKVLALHVEGRESRRGICSGCGANWPCPTVKVLNGEKP